MRWGASLPPHRTYLRLCVDSVLLCVRALRTGAGPLIRHTFDE
jgi:hypothetical protein